ncbi:MAG: hypothetical protein ACKO5M_04790, partial [Vulcanococcus sp.]
MLALSRLAARVKAVVRYLLHRQLAGLIPVVVPLVLTLLLALNPSSASAAAPATSSYRCDGDPLIAEVHQGAVDAPGIPNSDGGTVPGAFLVLRWRDLQLQLPRTNNAGTPSYTDGRWWWQALDP